MNRPEPLLDLVLGWLVLVGFYVVPLAFIGLGVAMLWGWLA